MAGKRFSSDAEPWKAAALPAAATTKPGQNPAQDKPQAQSLTHSSSFRASFNAASDQQLFQTPIDLVCPITLTLFQDPVINALGQVYERAAIQRHLIQAAVNGQPPTDPVSNATLPSLDLVPVFPMRSRAAEYRESAARTCMAAAAAPDCQEPVRYLRRAAELVLSTASDAAAGGGSPRSTAGATTAAAAAAGPLGSSRSRSSLGLSIPGMTLDFARYLVSHQGSAFDALALKYFGNELLRAGCSDAAADVFYRLLLEAEERVQQAEYLQLCLDCWTSSSSSGSSGSPGASSVDGSSSSSADSAAVKSAGAAAVAAAPAGSSVDGEQAGSTTCDQQRPELPQQQQALSAAQPPAAAAAAVNPVIVDKLADFVQRQHSLSPSAIIHMLQEMTHGPAMALQLCQVLLARAAAAAAAAAQGTDVEAALGLPGGLGGALELLLALVDLSSGQLQQQQHQLAAQLQVLEAAQQQQEKNKPGRGSLAAGEAATAGGAGPNGAASAAAAASAGAAVPSGSRDRQSSRSGHIRGPARLGHLWSGGKGRQVLLGRAARGAAAGTLAVASLFGGNQLLWRLARVGPLMYLLRAGL